MRENLIYFYAMHRYDVIFYTRLLDSMQVGRIEVTLIIPEYLLDIPAVSAHVHLHFKRILVIPTRGFGQTNLISKFNSWFALRGWYNKNINRNSTLVSLDKSSLLSRFFLGRSRKCLLIQQKENIGKNYALDVWASLKDFIRCLVVGACFASHYVSRGYGAAIGGLKVISYGKKDHFRIIRHSPSQSDPSQLHLPPLKRMEGRKVVIFGSRFLSWPYFNSVGVDVRIGKLRGIYDRIRGSLWGSTFIYIPHPLEKGEEITFLRDIFGATLSVDTECFSAEHFLYNNRDVSLTFSIGSTSSRSAYCMGFPSKVFYQLLDFPSDVVSVYDDIFFGISDRSFFASSQEDLLPEPTCSDATSIDGNFQSFLP